MRKAPARSAAKGRGPATAVTLQQALAAAARAMQAGRLGEAEEWCARIGAADPLNLDAMQLRASIAFQRGQPEAAERLLRRVIALSPRDADARGSLGAVLHALGRYEAAAGVLREALALRPGFAGAHLNLGNVYFALGQLQRAEVHLRKALAIDPGFAPALANLAEVLVTAGRAEEAIAVSRRLITLAPGRAVGFRRLGESLARAGRGEEALAALATAVAINPGDVVTRLGHARILGSLGRMDEAVAECRAVLALDPGNVQAHVAMARFRTFTREDEDVVAMEALAARAGTPQPDRVGLGFALGKVREDFGDYRGAIGHFLEANRLHRKTLGYSHERSAERFRDVRETFTAALVDRFRDAGVDDRLPIFVVGMPRSGTTLTEQILAAHPAVAGAGELSELPMLLGALAEELEAKSLEALFARVESARLTRLAADYLGQLRTYAGGSARVVDKLPGNFLNLGLIRTLFPGASIIHCRRAAADTCLSIFKTQFDKGTQEFGYDLRDLGRYYRLYEALMEHWRTQFPGAFHELDYEALVADQRGETERLLAFCGLDWSDDCLRFHDAGRAVQTASVAQVRKPIHSRSVGLSGRYGGALAPLQSALGAESPPTGGRGGA